MTSYNTIKNTRNDAIPVKLSIFSFKNEIIQLIHSKYFKATRSRSFNGKLIMIV